MKFEDIDLRKIHVNMLKAFDKILPLVNDPERTGLACAIGDHNGLIKVSFTIKEPPLHKRLKYYTLGGEKVMRLGEHPEHLTSEESANEELNLFGGAFRTDLHLGDILAISGFPSGNLDTATGLLGLLYANCINERHANLVGQNNPIWQRVLKEIL